MINTGSPTSSWSSAVDEGPGLTLTDDIISLLCQGVVVKYYFLKLSHQRLI